MQEPIEAHEELPTREAGGGRGKEAREEPQKLILQPIPINLDPSATAQPKNSPLPVHILPSPAAQSTPKTPAVKAKASSSLLVQNLKKLVASIQVFATTSKNTSSYSHCMTQRIVRVLVQTWCTWTSAFLEAPPVPAASKGLRDWFGGSTVSLTFCFHLFYFI